MVCSENKKMMQQLPNITDSLALKNNEIKYFLLDVRKNL